MSVSGAKRDFSTGPRSNFRLKTGKWQIKSLKTRSEYVAGCKENVVWKKYLSNTTDFCCEYKGRTTLAYRALHPSQDGAEHWKSKCFWWILCFPLDHIGNCTVSSTLVVDPVLLLPVIQVWVWSFLYSFCFKVFVFKVLCFCVPISVLVLLKHPYFPFVGSKRDYFVSYSLKLMVCVNYFFLVK